MKIISSVCIIVWSSQSMPLHISIVSWVPSNVSHRVSIEKPFTPLLNCQSLPRLLIQKGCKSNFDPPLYRNLWVIWGWKNTHNTRTLYTIGICKKYLSPLKQIHLITFFASPVKSPKVHLHPFFSELSICQIHPFFSRQSIYKT